MKINALGFIEVRGLVAAIEAADAMVKAANVRLIKQHNTNPGLITVVVEGDVAACRAAVDAGTAAASRLSTVISRIEIPRPSDGVEDLLLEYLDDAASLEVKKKAPSGKTKNLPAVKSQEKTLPATIKSNAVVKPSTSLEATKKIGVVAEKDLIAFIKSSKQGKTYKEIMAHFKGAQDLDVLLSNLVEHKKVNFKQMRYSVK